MYPHLNFAMRTIPHFTSSTASRDRTGILEKKMECQTVLYLKPFGTLQMINTFQRRGLQKQNDLISRDKLILFEAFLSKRQSRTSCYQIERVMSDFIST
jgi:hypothetical protein